MSGVVTTTTKKPVVDTVTIKLNRSEANDLIAAYTDVYARNRYAFTFDGKQSPLVKQIQDALDGATFKIAPTFADVFARAYAV